MKHGKSEKPRADIAHDSNENQPVEVRIAKRLTSLAAAYFGGRRNLPYTEVTSLGQRVVAAAEGRYRIFPVSPLGISDATDFLASRQEFSLGRAIRCSRDNAVSDDSPEWGRYGVMAVSSQDGSERDYILLVVARGPELAFLAAGLLGHARVLCGEFASAFTSAGGDVEGPIDEFRGFISGFFEG